MAPIILDFCRRAGRPPSITLHDPLAVAVACDPTLVRTERRPVRVEARGEHTAGMTVVDRRLPAPEAGAEEGPMVDVAMAVDAERALAMIVDRLASP
jgi:purine nucleosidase